MGWCILTAVCVDKWLFQALNEIQVIYQIQRFALCTVFAHKCPSKCDINDLKVAKPVDKIR